MLTSAQINTIKSSSSPMGGGAMGGNPTTPYVTPEQAKASFTGTPTATPPKTPITGTNAPNSGIVGDALSSLADTTKQNMKTGYQSSYDAIGSDVKNAAGSISQAGQDLGNGNVGGALANTGKAVVQGGLSTLSDAISYFLTPLSAATKTVTDTVSGTNPNAQGLSDIPAVQKLSTGSVGNIVQGAQDALTQAAQAHPVLAKALTDAFNVAMTAAGGTKAPEAVDILGQGAKRDASAISNAVTGVTDKVGDVASNVKNKITPSPVEPVDTLNRESGRVTPEQAQASAWKDIQPKDTPSTKLAYAKQGNTTAQGLVTSGKLTPSTADAKLIDSYSKLYEDGTIKEGMTPQEKQAAVSQKAAQLNGQQKEFLATHDKAVNLNSTDVKGKATGLFDFLDATAKKSSMPFAKDASAKGAYDSAIDTFKAQLQTGGSAGTVKGATTLSKIDQALSSFDSEMRKFDAWGKTKTGEMTDTGMARQQAIRDVHTQVRNFISNNLPKNSPWTAIRLEESNMYQIGDRLAQRSADTVGTSKIGSAMKKNPVIRAGVNAAASVPIIGAGVHLIP